MGTPEKDLKKGIFKGGFGNGAKNGTGSLKLKKEKEKKDLDTVFAPKSQKSSPRILSADSAITDEGSMSEISDISEISEKFNRIRGQGKGKLELPTKDIKNRSRSSGAVLSFRKSQAQPTKISENVKKIEPSQNSESQPKLSILPSSTTVETKDSNSETQDSEKRTEPHEPETQHLGKNPEMQNTTQ